MFNKIKSAITILNAWLFLISMSNVYCDDENFPNSLPSPRCEYESVVLLTGIGIPYNLHTHKVSNTLFFSFVKQREHDFQVASFNLNSNEFNPITGLKGGCSVAIDQLNDVIYLGGSNGIFTYNKLTRIANAYAEMERNIWAMFYKYKLFYISYPKQTLYIQNDSNFSTVKEFEGVEVDTFFIGNEGLILYTTKTGFYSSHVQSMERTLINKFWHVRQITEDNLNNVYVATNSGVFVYTPELEFSKVLNFNNVMGLTFDKFNNLIFSSGSNIVMLKFDLDFNETCTFMAPED